jgi:hypothetical protein
VVPVDENSVNIRKIPRDILVLLRLNEEIRHRVHK